MFQGLTIEPLISPALWMTLAILSAALLFWYGRERVGTLSKRRWIWILSLTGLGMGAVLLILLNPIWVEPIAPPAGKPLLTILIDNSASMDIADVEEGKTRFQSAIRIAEALTKDLQSRFDVRIRKFSGNTSPTDLSELPMITPDGSFTDLTGAITSGITDDRPQGQALFLLSDGIHNGPGGIESLLDVLRTTKAMAVPVYTKTLGGNLQLKDLELLLNRPQELSFAGQNVPVEVAVKQRGLVTDKATVSLLSEGKEIESHEVRLAADATTNVLFNVKQKVPGLYRYEVRLKPLSQEATSANNSATLLLQVVKEPIRVLLLEGKPYWDGKFLMRTLAADPSLELDAVVKMSETRYLKRSLRLQPTASSGNPDSPAADIQRTESSTVLSDPHALLNDVKQISQYQVIVLGRDSECFLSEALVERLKNWVSRDGGSLVCYRGSPVASVSQELAQMLPVRWSPTRESRFRMSLTDRGANLNWLVPSAESDQSMLNQLPSLTTHAKPERLKPLAVVLARSQSSAESDPVVMYQSYGTGRVVTIEGSGMWRWAFLAPQFQKHDEIYGSLWQSLLRWLVSSVGLVPGQDMVLRSEKVRYATDEPVSALLLMREDASGDAVPSVELTDSTGKTLDTVTPVPLGDEPGVYQVLFGQLPEGRYRSFIKNTTGKTDQRSSEIAFDVRQQFLEKIEVAARSDIMARIASESGGTVIEDPNPEQFAREFQEHLSDSLPQRTVRFSAWDRWWVLICVVLIWGTAWGMRRAGGLV
ncbi:hypothetical protein Pan241w_20380 [Gimesia alba]|uniref:VWFA domain-containing protein n=1 Tax=Gimesia alba TaxID=2527973 RepID=A0A517RDK1_9PLAN|nr:vWA domain-containing protein [Gimesia alba]QDT41958.1 hypothetical protein Pan241w_20380 [Gimesia alba]